jgi:hypothetical protein
LKHKIIIGAQAIVPVELVNEDKLRRILTIISIDSGYGNFQVELFKFNGDGTVSIPRYYAMKVFSGREDIEFEYQLSNGRPIEKFPEFKGELREGQKEVLEQTLAGVRNPLQLGGVVNLPVGSGKTVFGLYVASVLKLKTLVIVHKDFLVDQWKMRIEEFLPDARVGRVQQDNCDIENKDIVVGMVHSLAMKEDYPQYMYREFGLIISDEVHRCAAPMFSQALPKFNARYRVGLSATVKRRDGTENVFFYSIGPIVAHDDVEEIAPKIKRVFTSNFQLAPLKMDIPLSRLISMCAKNYSRNMIIVGQIVGAVKSSRKIIVMSHRLDQLHILENLINSVLVSEGLHLKYSIGYYFGGMSRSRISV